MYYYGATGLAMGQFVTQIFVSADAWAGSNLIVPTDPWILYDAQVPSASASSTTSTVKVDETTDSSTDVSDDAAAAADATIDSTII